MDDVCPFFGSRFQLLIITILLAGLRPRLWACEAATPRVEEGGRLEGRLDGMEVGREVGLELETGRPGKAPNPPYIPYSAEIIYYCY